MSIWVRLGSVPLMLILILAADAPAPREAVVPFEVLASNHLMVRATINGKGPFRLVVDVGSPISLLSPRAGEAAGVVKPGAAPRSLLASLRGETAIEILEIGGLTVKRLPVIVFDHPALRALGALPGEQTPDGLIGFTFFARYRTTFDYQAREMTCVPVKFQARDLFNDRPAEPRRRILAPVGLFGLTVAEPADPLTAAGVRIVGVLAGSPAEIAGLKPGDILTSLDGRWTASVIDAFSAASTAAPGRAVETVIVRDGKTLTRLVLPKDGF